MIYSEDQLKEMERLASLYIPITDIATVLDINAEALKRDIADKGSEASRAYRKGKAAATVKLHEQEMELARIGSPLALESVRRNLMDMEDDE